jgi:two-component system response regulator MprA
VTTLDGHIPWNSTKIVSMGLRPRVLVIDDERSVRAIASRALTAHDLEVHCASDGREALDLLAEAPGFALVVLDACMPGLGGDQVLAAMHERGDDTPVLMISGFGAPTDSLAPNLCGFLAKPFTVGELTGRVLALLGRA